MLSPTFLKMEGRIDFIINMSSIPHLYKFVYWFVLNVKWNFMCRLGHESILKVVFARMAILFVEIKGVSPLQSSSGCMGKM